MLLRSSIIGLILFSTVDALAAPSGASAGATPDPVQATPATLATTAGLATDGAIDAHFDALQDGRPCATGCPQAIVKRVALGHGRTLEVRDATTAFGPVYAVAFGRPGAWAVAPPIDDIVENDCGMGKCATDTVTAIAVAHTATRLWVTFTLRSTISYNATGRADHHRSQIVVGCTRTAAPTCATVYAGSRWDGGAARISGDAVIVHAGDGGGRVPIQF
jgi:hypothetical protein